MQFFQFIAWALVVVSVVMLLGAVLGTVTLFRDERNLKGKARTLRNKILYDVKTSPRKEKGFRTFQLLRWAAVTMGISWIAPVGGVIFFCTTVLTTFLVEVVVERKARSELGMMK